MRRNWGVRTRCKTDIWSTTGIVVTTILHSHCRSLFSLIQREGCVCVLAFCFGSEQHQDPAGMCPHIHECAPGSGLARDTWPHVSSTAEKLSVAMPYPNFILSIPQQTKRFWVTGESSSELFRLKAWLGCVLPDPMDITLPSVKAFFQSRIDLRPTKIYLNELLNYSADTHHLTGKGLAWNDSPANKCLESYTSFLNLNWVTPQSFLLLSKGRTERDFNEITIMILHKN